MKHIFVVNPQAGGSDSSRRVAEAIGKLEGEVEMYVTRAPRDATRYVAGRAREERGLRFYACGGDGTLNEVVTGAMAAGAGADVAVGCYPCGSGNDYVKYWPQAAFTDCRAQVAGPTVEVDVMRVGDRCCINTLNFGFEAEVCRTMADVRRKPLVGRRMAYPTGIVKSLATSRRNYCRVSVDGAPWFDGDLLLASLANGIYAGGGYRCAPRAVCDDGWLEVMAIRPLPLHRFVAMIGHYERGEHLDLPSLQDAVRYCRGRRVVLESERPFYIALDGELTSGTRFEVENCHRALRFIVPDSPATKQ